MVGNTGGRTAVRVLERMNISVLFGIPGIHNLSIYDGLASGTIRHVTTRHEQGAGFMAYGWGKSTGTPGVALAITGPGLTNLLTPLGQAFHDSVPMVAITTQIPSRFLSGRSGYLHELRDSTVMSSSVTKGSFRASSPGEIPLLLERALRLSVEGRPGPVHVEIPLDYLDQDCGGLPAEEFDGRERNPLPEGLIGEAAGSLSAARSPFIIAGGGAAGASAAVRILAEKLSAPVVMTSAGKGILPDGHPLSLGARLHFPAVKELLRNSDCILALGTELSPPDLWEEEFPFPDRMISVDTDDGFASSRKGLFLGGRCEDVVPMLAGAVKDRGGISCPGTSALLGECRDALGAVLGVEEDLPLLHDTVSALADALGDEGALWADMTGAAYFAISEYPCFRPRTFLHPVGFGTLGAALPGGLGTKCAFPDRRVAVLTGDGGFQFTLSELAVGVQEKICLPVLLWNDGGFGEIRRTQDRNGGPRIAVDQWNPDFRVLAQAYGIPYFAPEDGAGIGQALESAFEVPTPSIIEVKVRKGAGI
jgi:thiamine pyrophosphate-dependent acetolactate synthase large subunit-like protein